MGWGFYHCRVRGVGWGPRLLPVQGRGGVGRTVGA